MLKCYCTKSIIRVLFCLLCFTSCSSQKKSGTTHAPLVHAEEITSIELYLKRSSIQAEEFEKLKLLQNTLYTECGVFSNGRQVPKRQSITNPEEAEILAVKKAAAQIMNLLQAKSHTFTPPEGQATFYSPGKYLLSVQTTSSSFKIETSLDSVTEPPTIHEKSLYRLAVELRALGEDSLCGRRSFYGLGSERS